MDAKFGEMVSYQHPNITSVPFKDAIKKHNFVTLDTALMRNARGVGISFGD